MLDWSSGGILVRLILSVVIFLYFAVRKNRWKHIHRFRGYDYFILALALLACSQVFELYQAFTLDRGWVVLQETILILAFVMFAIFLVYMAIDGDRLLEKGLHTRERESWLVSIFEYIPAAVAVVNADQFRYTNQSFRQLQQQFGQENPFSGAPYVHKGSQEIVLQDSNGKHATYWIAQYPIDNNDDRILIVSDITEIKEQGMFMHNLAEQLNDKNANLLEVVLDTLERFIPGSFAYVASYDENDGALQCLAHRGNYEPVSRIREYDFAQSPLNKNNEWLWFDGTQLKGFNEDPFVRQCNPESLGGIRLCDHDGNVIGLILILLEKRQHIDQIILDFLSVFSHRVRAEIEHMKFQQIIRDSDERYKAFISRSREAIAHVDIQPAIDINFPVPKQWQLLIDRGNLKESNKAFDTLFNVSEDASIGALFEVKSLKHVIQYVLTSGYGHETLDVAHYTLAGELKWLACSVMASIEDGLLSRLWLIVRDDTESRSHIQHLQYLAQHDVLTNLPNRTALRDTLDEKIEQASQFGFDMALLLIDLDRFKEINDALGHHYGDVLLQKIAPRIKSLLSDYRAYLARLGGDEFAVLMPSLQNFKEAETLANSVMSKLREPFDLGPLNVEIAGSVGIAFYPNDGKDSSTLLRCADVAMYKAKSTAIDVLCYSQDLDDHNPRRLAVMTALRQSIREEQLYLVFQPKVTLADKKIRGVEALIRWQHPEHGLMSPAEFIPLAELTDVIIPMTEWVIERALSHIAQWQAAGVSLVVAANVSTRNLLDDNFLPAISAALKKYNVSSQLLEIEITESALMVDPERALVVLKQLSELGVSLAVDDFGTGYSSLAYLRQLPIDCLKIDLTFVRHMLNNPQDEIIVNSIVNLSHNLSLKVVAEGVEDDATFGRLADMGCDHAQGFFISAPIEANYLLGFIDRWNMKG